MRRVHRDGAAERGATVAEYAILLGLLAVVVLGGAYALGLSVFGTLQDAGEALADPTSVLGSTVTNPGGGGDGGSPPSGDPVPVELTGSASEAGGTWTATVSVTSVGPDGVVVTALWVTESGASGTTTCTLSGGSCALTLPSFAADAGGPTTVTVTVSAVGDAPAQGDPVVVDRP
jgi:Flp pilus assembly pilin Flp